MTEAHAAGHGAAHETQTPWPAVAGFSAIFLALGVALKGPFLPLGIAVFAFAAVGWLRDDLHGRKWLAPHGAVQEPPFTGIGHRKLGIWLFLGSEIMFFTALIGTFIMYRSQAPNWPNPSTVLNVPLTAFNTFVLLASSVTMVLALQGIQNGNPRRMRVFLLATFLLGAFFLSVQAKEYLALIHENFLPSTSLFGSTFYMTTGFHGAHVTGGVLALGFLNVKAARGGYAQNDHDAVELVGLYWHLVDIVWILLFTIVYLI